MKNKARPEGSIAEAYIVNESMTFCSMYLRNIETKFNRDRHFEVEFEDEQNVDKLSIFSQKACPFGGKSLIEIHGHDLEVAHWYILNNCEELQPYLR